MEVDIKFEPSGRTGVIPVGTYLYDAALRMGIEMADDCGRRGECDSCAVTVTEGRDLLSPATEAEKKVLSAERLASGVRLACQAKIEKTGELTIMVAEKVKTEEEKEAERKREVRKEFEELPLEKKVANLLELEMITLGETISFVLNSPYLIAGKVMDVMAGFGLKMDDDKKKATRPAEHAEDVKTGEDKNKKKQPKKDKATEQTTQTP